jgi:hypothetical protein
MGAVLAMKVLLYAAAFGLLAGCQPALQRIAGAQAPAQATISATALAGPVMRVQIPSRNANAQLSRVAVSNGVETWLAVDNISLSFREGVLVASRGLGFDLMAADATATLTAIAGQGAPVYRRQMRYLTGDHHATYLMAGCSMKGIGPETVNGQRLQRLEEKCQARQNAFTNIFWLNASGAIVVSRQWVSPEVGYIRSILGKKQAVQEIVILN